MKRAIVIANPRAGRARRKFRVADLVAQLKARGLDVSLAETTCSGDATEFARDAVRHGADLLVVCGGDGTLREVAEGMIGSTAVMLPLAGGTTNVVAAGLGLDGEPVDILARLDALQVRELDAGLCGGRPFLMQVSTGIDAVIMAQVRQDMKQRFGKSAVAMTGVRCWLGYGFPEIAIAIDGVEHVCRGAIVMNFPFYAGRYRLSPDSRADDGRMEVLLFTGRNRYAAAGFAIDLALGRHLRRGDVKIHNANTVRFLSPASVPLQVDGEAIWPDRPVEITLSPHRLRVMCAADAPLLAHERVPASP